LNLRRCESKKQEIEAEDILRAEQGQTNEHSARILVCRMPHERLMDGVRNVREPVLVIDIGGTKIAGAIAFPDGRIEYYQTRPTRGVEGGDAIMRRAIELAQAIIVAGETKLVAMGVSTGGDVGHNGEIVYATATIPGWQGMAVRARLEAALGLRVFVDNDGNAMALGEAMFGAGRGYAHILGIVVGTGIGGGIVLNRKIYRGAQGFAGRLGHVIVDFTEQQPCTCGGAGCLEAHAASLALIADYKKRTNPPSRDPSFGVKEIAQLAESGDVIAVQVIQRGAYFLGIGIASFLNLFNPDRVIVGGGIAQIGERYFAEVRRVAHARAQGSVRDTPIVPATLGTHANLIGAAELAWQGLGKSNGSVDNPREN
jgi:glucokinase